MINIKGLSNNDKINRMILSNSLINSIVNQIEYKPCNDEEQITDDELQQILQVISEKTYYITEFPKFEYIDNMRSISCIVDSLSFINKEELVKLISDHYKNKFLIFYSLTKSQGRYSIRLSAIDDIIQIRDNKINEILDE
jgi:hypothetical protein